MVMGGILPYIPLRVYAHDVRVLLWPTVAITSKWCPTLYSAVRNRANTKTALIVKCSSNLTTLQHKKKEFRLHQTNLIFYTSLLNNIPSVIRNEQVRDCKLCT